MAKSFGYEVHAVFFDVPLEVCLERNSKRERQVTDEIMHKMAERLKPPTFKEGFEKITAPFPGVITVRGEDQCPVQRQVSAELGLAVVRGVGEHQAVAGQGVGVVRAEPQVMGEKRLGPHALGAHHQPARAVHHATRNMIP